MKRAGRILCILLAILAAVSLTAADQGGAVQKYLTTADIQGATGLVGVKLSDSTDHVMHFANREGHPILIAKFLTRSTRSRKRPAMVL